MGISNSKNMYLSGPTSVSIISNKNYKKKILLIGDEHFSYLNLCKDNYVDIIKFLDNIFVNTEKKLDFFLEISYEHIELDSKFPKNFYETMKKSEKYAEGYLNKVRVYYQKYKCFYRDKKECKNKFPNVRFHNMDFRFSLKCNDAYQIIWMIEFLRYFHFLLNDENMTSLKIEHELDLLKNKKLFLNVLKEFKSFENLEKKINKVMKCKKMNDQIRKCDKLIQSKINKYYKEFMNQKKKEYNYIFQNHAKKLQTYINNYNSWSSITNISSTVYILMEIIIDITCIIMDIYSIARIMKKLDNDNYENNIIYAGDSHIDNYKNFFGNYLNFKTNFTGKPISKRCIDISDINLNYL